MKVTEIVASVSSKSKRKNIAMPDIFINVKKVTVMNKN